MPDGIAIILPLSPYCRRRGLVLAVAAVVFTAVHHGDAVAQVVQARSAPPANNSSSSGRVKRPAPSAFLEQDVGGILGVLGSGGGKLTQPLPM